MSQHTMDDRQAWAMCRHNIDRWARHLNYAPGFFKAQNYPLDSVDHPWPFESHLMLEVLETFQKGETPAHEDLMLLTMCSDMGEICPGMQPSRGESQRNIDALIAAMQKAVNNNPGQDGVNLRCHLRLSSAATHNAPPGTELMVEAGLPYKALSPAQEVVRAVSKAKDKERKQKRAPSAARVEADKKRKFAARDRWLKKMSKRGMFPFRDPTPTNGGPISIAQLPLPQLPEPQQLPLFQPVQQQPQEQLLQQQQLQQQLQQQQLQQQQQQWQWQWQCPEQWQQQPQQQQQLWMWDQQQPQRQQQQQQVDDLFNLPMISDDEVFSLMDDILGEQLPELPVPEPQLPQPAVEPTPAEGEVVDLTVDTPRPWFSFEDLINLEPQEEEAPGESADPIQEPQGEASPDAAGECSNLFGEDELEADLLAELEKAEAEAEAEEIPDSNVSGELDAEDQLLFNALSQALERD